MVLQNHAPPQYDDLNRYVGDRLASAVDLGHRRMSELYAWINPTSDGEESIIAALLPGMGHVPFVNAKRRVMASPQVRAIISEHVAQYGHPARLVRFIEAGEIDTVEFKPP